MTGFEPNRKLTELCKCLDIPDRDLRKLMKIFEEELKKGLDERTADKASLKCLITYVQDFPTGEEKGKYLALQLDGILFRLILINISTKIFDLRAKQYALPTHITKGTGTELFDYLAECLCYFATEHRINKDHLQLGFSFGFPLYQRGLRIGILQHWTKHFSCSGVVGKNVVEMLQAAICRQKDLYVEVAAVLNNTTGTLMSCSWKSPKCKIGLIVGAGLNACYVERVSRIKKPFHGDESKPFVIVDTESGGFGDRRRMEFVRTAWDRKLDAESSDPGVNICEKMVSGLYLGELVRRVLLTAADRGHIFEGKVVPRLKTQGGFDTDFILDLVDDLPGQHRAARTVLRNLGYPTAWPQDCVDLEFACEAAWKRAARIAAAQIAALLNYMDYPDVTVGLDGVILREHPGFLELLSRKARHLTRRGIKFQCILSDDRGGLGAALVAAVAARERRKM